MNGLSGTYRGRSNTSAFAVRFDLVPAESPGGSIVSGDVFLGTSELANYVASFYSTSISISDNQLIASVEFPRKSLTGRLTCLPLPSGVLSTTLILRNELGAVVSTDNFTLEKEGDHFRKVLLEVDLVSGTDEPGEHELNNVRVTLSNRFENAGVLFLPGEDRTIIDVSEASTDERWSPAELNAAMERHFRGFRRDEASWCVYMLIATRYINDSTTGIMFDQFGRHRQGVAVFHTTRKAVSSTANFQRDYIRTVLPQLKLECRAG